jgi:hypothetical protein
VVNVAIGDNFFSPQTITVTVGTTVHWTNSGSHVHTTTSSTGLWDSGNLSSGQTFDYTFNSTGTFPYFCQIHGNMTATVIVVGCAQSTATSTSTPTITPTPTRTYTPTSTRTLTPTNTLVATSTPTFTATFAPTSTRTYTYTPSNTPTNTYIPTAIPTYTPTTPTEVPLSIFVGHVVWQGALPQPDPRQQQPVSLTLWLQAGGPYYDYPAQNTDSSGLFTVTLSGVPGGLYNWRVKSPKFLSNRGAISISGAAQNYAECGLMRAGDANNDNVANSADFIIMKDTFAKALGDPGYDARADFSNDNVVNTNDFSLLKSNFGQSGYARMARWLQAKIHLWWL